jgi:D-alanyl-D-alanine carboxypeptidase
MNTLTLGQLQRKFLIATAHLIEKIYEDGFEGTYDEAHRTDEQAAINALTLDQRKRVALLTKSEFPQFAAAMEASTSKGVNHSVHRLRLALDLNLFKDGKFLDDAADYLPFGTWWKSTFQAFGARWGGDWGDADHFSFEYGGVK